MRGHCAHLMPFWISLVFNSTSSLNLNPQAVEIQQLKVEKLQDAQMIKKKKKFYLYEQIEVKILNILPSFHAQVSLLL